jgi:hypothetical protein
LPCSSVVAVFSTPAASLAVTTAPIMTPPSSSFTFPRKVPRDCCADAAVNKPKNRTAAHRVRAPHAPLLNLLISLHPHSHLKAAAHFGNAIASGRAHYAGLRN